jgi:hypothetical protein
LRKVCSAESSAVYPYPERLLGTHQAVAGFNNRHATDITFESGCFDCIGRKAASGAINPAKVDVAEQEKLRAIGEADAKSAAPRRAGKHHILSKLRKRDGMTKKNLALLMEWLRPAGIGVAVYFACFLGSDALAQFHRMGPWVVLPCLGPWPLNRCSWGEPLPRKSVIGPIVPIRFNRGWPMPLPQSRHCLSICWIGDAMQMLP